MKVQFVLTITCSPSSPPLPRQFNPQEAREMRTPPDDAKRVSPGAARPRLFGRNLRGREIGAERRRRLAPRRRRRRSPERERRSEGDHFGRTITELNGFHVNPTKGPSLITFGLGSDLAYWLRCVWATRPMTNNLL